MVAIWRAYPSLLTCVGAQNDRAAALRALVLATLLHLDEASHCSLDVSKSVKETEPSSTEVYSPQKRCPQFKRIGLKAMSPQMRHS